MRLTQKIAKEFVRQLGGRLIRNVEWEEFIVKVGAEQEYHCTDLNDAIETARVMLGGSDTAEQAEEYLRLMLA